MSYDISLITNVNGKRYSVVDAGNYTSNIRSMLDEAFEVPDWKYINGMVCKEAMFLIEKAVARMQANRDHYKTFNPKNGWGKYESALKWLLEVWVHCQENPDLTIEIDS